MDIHCETRKKVFGPLQKETAPLPLPSWQGHYPHSKELEKNQEKAANIEKEEDKEKKKT